MTNNLITKSNENHDDKVNEKDITKEKEDIRLNIINWEKNWNKFKWLGLVGNLKDYKQQIDNLSENNKILKRWEI